MSDVWRVFPFNVQAVWNYRAEKRRERDEEEERRNTQNAQSEQAKEAEHGRS